MDFDVEILVSSSRDKISAMPLADSVVVAFVPVSKIDKWECRATKVNDDFGEGVGLLLAEGSTVEANSTTEFTIAYSALTFGDGDYRISLYAESIILGEPRISFDYDGLSNLIPYLNYNGSDYVYLADLKKGEYITATNVIYLYDGMDVISVACGAFSGFYYADRDFIVLGDSKLKISGYILGGGDNNE